MTPLLSKVSTLRRALAGMLTGLITGLLLYFTLETQLPLLFHLAVYTLLGLIFGLIFGRKISTTGAGLVWGEAYGIGWWFLGPLTLIPLWQGQGATWTLSQVQIQLPSLFGNLIGCGLILGLGYAMLVPYLARILPTDSMREVKPPPMPIPTGQNILPPLLLAIIVGGLGGLFSAWVYVWGIETAQFYPLVARLVGLNNVGVGQFLHYSIGLVIGASFGLLFSRDIKGIGPGIVWGMNYGFLWWMLGALTLFPIFIGQGIHPDWSLEVAQMRFSALIAHVLYGALVGLFYALFNQLWRSLFIDSDPVNRSLEGVGTRSFRSLLMGQAGGITGGLLYAIVLTNLGALPNIAKIVGSDSSFVGLLVHLVIGTIIGSTFGLLFQREAYSYGTDMAWGMIYGLLWWFLGSMTLYALLLGQPVNWSLEAAIVAYPALVGHLLYGAGLGIFFQFLARRYDDTVTGRIQRGTLGTRLAALENRLPPVLIIGRPATALWVVTLILGILLPLLLFD